MTGSTTYRLAYPKAALWSGIACAILGFGVGVLSIIHPDCGATVWSSIATTLGLLAFAALGLYLVAAYFYGWYLIDDKTLDYPLVGVGRGKLKWSDVKRAYANDYLQVLVLQTGDGRKAYISAGLDGALSIYDIVMTYVPREAVDPKMLKLMLSVPKDMLR